MATLTALACNSTVGLEQNGSSSSVPSDRHILDDFWRPGSESESAGCLNRTAADIPEVASSRPNSSPILRPTTPSRRGPLASSGFCSPWQISSPAPVRSCRAPKSPISPMELQAWQHQMNDVEEDRDPNDGDLCRPRVWYASRSYEVNDDVSGRVGGGCGAKKLIARLSASSTAAAVASVAGRQGSGERAIASCYIQRRLFTPNSGSIYSDLELDEEDEETRYRLRARPLSLVGDVDEASGSLCLVQLCNLITATVSLAGDGEDEEDEEKVEQDEGRRQDQSNETKERSGCVCGLTSLPHRDSLASGIVSTSIPTSSCA
ncbi:unnamed protein product [Protopolystoma xenopodis]|uniref:Uncharacterized protein n=1 Tax=Protopolystoma xenopodis TaxID=117903 RepID=A0A3S5CM99_9PLAT|nr:unnamed protein product [Protopolystoma xenopodis]